MGLHTWFHKDKKIYDEIEELYNELDKHENYEIYLDDIELLQLNTKIDKLEDINKANYHDCFRTSKREVGNDEYTLDKIYSKYQCEKWLDDNKDSVYFSSTIFDTPEQIEKYTKYGLEQIDKFWYEYPDGVIDFG